MRSDLQAVLESAARLQELVPDAVLVGGSAAALHAGHRTSCDHDHVLADLAERFEIVLGALEADPDWVTNRVVPGKIVLGEIGDVESGIRELIRRVPLQTQTEILESGRTLVVPTLAETLRVKAYLIVKRNQVRDYLDVAALADRMGVGSAADVLADIDTYYTDPAQPGKPLCSQLVRQLGRPRPKDSSTLQLLSRYKGLAPRWQQWAEVVAVCTELAATTIRRAG